jgi:hypothetical protein
MASEMLTIGIIAFALAATGVAVPPEGYRTVYITSKQDTKFVIVPKGRTAGNTLVVYVPTICSYPNSLGSPI